MTRMVSPDESFARGQIKEGFVDKNTTFIIADDLFIMHANMESEYMRLEDASDDIVEMDVNVSQKEVSVTANCMQILLKCFSITIYLWLIS